MAHDEVCQLWNVSSDAEELQRKIRLIQDVVEDAEKRQTSNKDIARWVYDLKDVLYDAEDAFQLREMTSNKRSTSSESFVRRLMHDSKSCMCNLFIDRQFVKKIKKINSRMEIIMRETHQLGLSIAVRDNPDHAPRMALASRTDPCFFPTDLVGEKVGEDAEELIELLTKEEEATEEQGNNNIQIVAIEGIAGIGKSTLARKICDDLRIQEGFSLHIWIWVSKQKKADEEIVRNVIREVGGDYGRAEETSELLPILKQCVAGKKYFLVLDDVWAAEVWNRLLRQAMIHGAPGSRVLVTTRDSRVARQMAALHHHKVERLSDGDGLTLLMRLVFRNESEAESEHLNDIGMQLVKKCDGLPLAIRSIAGILCNNHRSRGEWQAVLRSNVWSMSGEQTDVHKAFYVSYEALPLHLRQCFLFCSLFPEDFKFKKPILIHLWLAEGYLKGTGNLQDTRNAWDLGTEYYNELLSRNFLEDTGVFYDQHECKMHDVLWSFARCLGKAENSILREGSPLSNTGSPKVRRLSVEGNTVNTNIIMKEKSLRTLLVSNKHEIALHDICKSLSCLRILDLSESNISSLPASLSNLKLLRYLHVGGTKISTLPESIGNLRNLLYLNCARCKELIEVPHSITDLSKLEFLSFDETSVKGIPTSLQNLKKLVYLFGFKPAKNTLDGFSSLDELEPLSQLVVLNLVGLENVADINTAKKAYLWGKDKMRELYLCCTSLSREIQVSQTNEERMRITNILNECDPPTQLEILGIEGYSGSTLPNWLKLEGVFPNLRSLEITNCACIQELAPLGQLSNLDFLRLSEIHSVEIVGQDFFWKRTERGREGMISTSRSTMPAFPKLSQLEFERMSKWKEWQWTREEPAMPKLKTLFIIDCPQLGSLPEGLSSHATTLEHLEIKGAKNLNTIESLQSLKNLCVVQNPKLERISDLPKISRVLIKNCSNLKALVLDVSWWMELVDYQMLSLPDYLRTTVPNKLTIRCNTNLWHRIKSQEESGGSEWLKFKHMPNVKIYTE